MINSEVFHMYDFSGLGFLFFFSFSISSVFSAVFLSISR